ncbi:MAG TPA: hypothetical protein VFB16_07700 [Bauldia sp.]|nr:hypothetical protein [Bauldia sp.]
MIPVLQDRCSPDEYQAYLKGIVSCLAESSMQLMNRIFAEHPALEEEIDARMRAARAAAGEA